MSLEEDSIPFQIQVRLTRFDKSQQRFLALWFSRKLKLNDIWLKIGRKLLTNHARQDQLTLPSNAALFNLGSRLWLFEGSGIIRFRIPHGSSDRWIWASSQSSCRAMDIHTYSHNIKRLGRVLSVTYYSGHIQTVERVWLTFQSGRHFFKSRAVHQPRSKAEQRKGGSFRILLSTLVLEGFVKPRLLHRSFMTWNSSWASFIINIASLWTILLCWHIYYIYILWCFSEFLFKFCSGSDRMASVYASMFKSLGSNMWTNRSGVPGWSRKANSLVLTRLTLRNKKRAILKRLHSNRCRFRYL